MAASHVVARLFSTDCDVGSICIGDVSRLRVG